MRLIQEPIGIAAGRRRALLLLLLLALAAPSAGCSKKPAEAANKPGGADSAQGAGATVTLPVVAQEVRKGDLILSVVTTGQIRSEAMSLLKSETQGTIVAVLVRPGDRVKKGQALVQVDPRPLDLAVQDAQAKVEEARLQYRWQHQPSQTRHQHRR